MRYVVGFTDPSTGSNKFRAYDYQNDAEEFVVLHKKKGFWAQLYKAVEPKSVNKPPKVPATSILCPVCKMTVPFLTNAGWCKDCQETME